MQVQELPYFPDSTRWFDALREYPWPVFLDSNYPRSTQGRYDIVSAAPADRIVVDSGDLRDPIELLQAKMPLEALESPFPFIGGAIGYFSYDLGRYFEILPNVAKTRMKIPDMMLGIYDWALIIDHVAQETHWVSLNRYPESKKMLENLKSLTPILSKQNDFSLTSDWASNLSFQEYAEKFEKIQHYIRDGDCYQVNLAQTFSANYSGDLWTAYQRLRAVNPVSFAAYLEYPELQVLSLSPERFLQVNHQNVTTKPIKGTRRRSSDPNEDAQLIIALKNSEKDRAENVMIVDLLRNDLGKHCEIGSVQVPALCALESFPTVHHLVSTVTGKLAKPEHVFDLLRGAFPGGSVTGAPKIRAMEIIDECEPSRRGIYCGSIGYIDYRGHMDTNIAIRTLTAIQNELFCSAGGALVADSKLADEYQETYDKVNVLLKALKG